MRTLGDYPPGSDSSFWWSSMGRNKKSIALDIRTPEGRDLFGELIKTTNVLIENFRPGTLDRWGMTKEWLHERRPDLIVTRISGYGQDGPWRNVPGFDRNAQAFAGLVYVTGEKETAPQQAGLPVCDYTAGLWAAFGVVTAMLGRLLQKDPAGSEIDLALYETMIPFLKDMPMTYGRSGKVTERTGNTPDYVAPGGAYLTGEKQWIFISGTGDRVFSRLMTAVGRADMANDPKFQHNKDRVTHRKTLDDAINGWLAQHSTVGALAALEKAEVPAAKIQSISDVMTHPQVMARQNFVQLPDHDRGDVCVTAPVPRLSRMPGTIRWLGQDRGEASEEILCGELKLSLEALAELRKRNIVG
jgi:crotonobetainyl-CoA:carnitine CoA-transferase CaiB-like acyl-CoA transferase